MIKNIIYRDILPTINILTQPDLGKEGAKMSYHITVITHFKACREIAQALDTLSAESYQLNLVRPKKSKSVCIAAKNVDKAIVPGSIIKILTLFLLFEAKIQLNQKITIHEEDLMPGSGNNLQVNDVITVRNLAKNMFFASSNSSAEVIKRLIERAVGCAFLEFVAHYLDTLSLKKTYVQNAHGLFHRLQQTTVQDFICIVSRTLKNKKMYKFLNQYSAGGKIKLKRQRKSEIIFKYKAEYPCIVKTGSLYPNVFNAVMIQKMKKHYLVACLGYCTNVATRKQDLSKLLLLI